MILHSYDRYPLYRQTPRGREHLYAIEFDGSFDDSPDGNCVWHCYALDDFDAAAKFDRQPEFGGEKISRIRRVTGSDAP